MDVVEWSNDFALGIEELDGQHRELLRLINELVVGNQEDAGPGVLRVLLTQLGDCAHEHFEFEERLMADSEFDPDFLAQHLGAHANFRSVLKGLTDDFNSGRTRISAGLVEYLVHWLLHHVSVMDRTMVAKIAAGPELASSVTEALMKESTEEMTKTERYLLRELFRTNREVERLVAERTRNLTEANRKLEAELLEMRKQVGRAAVK